MAEAIESSGNREGTPAEATGKKFGTLSGVFIPTLLTILGVIMYLREGWVVGQVGLAGTWIVILLSFTITGLTALSMASVATNIRIGAGGAYSIISQSLGIEIGGAIGMPLYISQSLAVAMYIFGFRAGWAWLFPDHPAILVDLLTFATLFGVAFISASFAFRIQYLILAVIIGSLVAVAVAASRGSMQYPVTWWREGGGFVGGNFWLVFAVYFPAATGIMAGANMSGDLKDPRKSIPVGTLSAIAISLVIYLVLGYWLARSATPQELRDNFTIMIDRSAWGPAVLAGLLGATFSSALSSLVGAPRILQALAQHRVVPGSGWLAGRSAKGEPRHALYLSAVIVLAALMLRDLNAIAPLITMFFLITYAMINAVVFIEQQMGLVSFRPLLRIPRWAPLLGAGGCIAAMFIVNPPFGLVAVVVVMVFYSILIRRHLTAPFGDVRSGVAVSLAQWMAKKVTRLPENRARGWKPNILAPVLAPSTLLGDYQLVFDLARPRGSVRILGIEAGAEPQPDQAFRRKVRWLAASFRNDGVYANGSIMAAESFSRGVVSAMDALAGTFFEPNALLLTLFPAGDESLDEVQPLVAASAQRDLGLLLFAEHSHSHLGRQETINLWVPRPARGWEWHGKLEGLDLAVLAVYKLRENWGATLRLIAQIEGDAETDAAKLYLSTLMDLARLGDAQTMTRQGWSNPPPADLNCIPLDQDVEQIDMGDLARRPAEIGTSCLFVRSAGQANALA
jgi:amino acid transporter